MIIVIIIIIIITIIIIIIIIISLLALLCHTSLSRKRGPNFKREISNQWQLHSVHHNAEPPTRPPPPPTHTHTSRSPLSVELSIIQNINLHSTINNKSEYKHKRKLNKVCTRWLCHGRRHRLWCLYRVHPGCLPKWRCYCGIPGIPGRCRNLSHPTADRAQRAARPLWHRSQWPSVSFLCTVSTSWIWRHITSNTCYSDRQCRHCVLHLRHNDDGHVRSDTDYSDRQCRHYVLSLRHEYDVTLPLTHVTVTVSVVIVYCPYVTMMTVMSARTQITVTVSVVIMYGLYVRDMTSHHEACIVSLINISINFCLNQRDNRTRADRHLATHTSKKVDR